MKKITVRQLMRDFKSIFPIPDEGILVTRQGGEGFVIYKVTNARPVRQDGQKEEEKINLDSLKPKEEVVTDLTYGMIKGWCQTHWEKGVDYELRYITWEDENGSPVVEKKWACPKCVTKYETMGRGHLYFLEGGEDK